MASGTDRSFLVGGLALALIGMVALTVATVVGSDAAVEVARPAGTVTTIGAAPSSPDSSDPSDSTAGSDAGPTPSEVVEPASTGANGETTVVSVDTSTSSSEAVTTVAVTTSTVPVAVTDGPPTTPLDTTPIPTTPAVAPTQAPPPPEVAVFPATCQQVHYVVVGDAAALGDHNGGWNDWCLPISVVNAISPRIVLDAGLTVNDACQLARAGEEVQDVTAPGVAVEC